MPLAADLLIRLEFVAFVICAAVTAVYCGVFILAMAVRNRPR